MQQMSISKARCRMTESRSIGHGIGGNRMAWLLIVTVIIVLLTATTVKAVQRQPSLAIEAKRLEYLDLEQALWKYLGRTGPTRTAQLKKVFDSHRDFNNMNMMSTFDAGKYDILNHYEWSLLEKDLLQINSIFDFYKNYLNKQSSSADLEERAILDICDTVLRNDKSFSMSRIFQDIELIMVKQTLYYRAMTASNDEICSTQQSAQQFVHSLFVDIALTELKGYTMMEFSWMMLKVYGKGNFSQEAELMRSDYQKRNERTVRLLREVMRRADRLVWRCDPAEYVYNKTYDAVTRLLQGYIENEVDMNNEETCREDCAFYQSTRSQDCFKNKFCARQSRCSGKLFDCQFVDSDMWVCPSPMKSIRRYEYIEYENGRVFGKKDYCARGTTKVDSWWRYLFWHCSYCFCLCDEISAKSDRYFNLRETISDIKNNKVVTGLRFIKKNRIFHLQIQEGELLPRGAINTSNIAWKPIDPFTVFESNVREGKDIHTLTYEKRSMDLDDVHTDDNSFVVTGVRFRLVGAHLNLEAHFCEFDFEKGKLIISESNNGFWKSNDNTDVSGEKRQQFHLSNPDLPINTIVRSIPDTKHNQFINFGATSMDKDAAQSTVPFIDIQDVKSNPPVPLAGVGVYHKGRSGYGGFIAPKLMTYDFTPHIQVPKNNA